MRRLDNLMTMDVAADFPKENALTLSRCSMRRPVGPSMVRNFAVMQCTEAGALSCGHAVTPGLTALASLN